MAVLVSLGTMQLAWMFVFAALIFLEKVAPFGERVAIAGAVVLFGVGATLLIWPPGLTHLI